MVSSRIKDLQEFPNRTDIRLGNFFINIKIFIEESANAAIKREIV